MLFGRRKMRSLSSVGLALSIVFGCLLLALLAELYYLLWCKKRRPDLRNDYSTPQTRKLLFIFCCNTTTTTTNPSSSSSSSSSFSNPKPIETQQQQSVASDGGFENVGPGLVPRFLFTIMEETVEEMESEDRVVSNKGKSLNDLFLNMESGATVTPPYLTPLASPSLFTPPFTPLMESCNGKKEEISSFFELSTDAEFNRLVRSSPLSSHSSPCSSSSSSPLPRFKFLRDAEEKLYKRKVMEIVESEELKG